jgi:hypothetical protein
VSYDLSRLASYVRFYQTVVTQLAAACQNLERTHASAKEALGPLGEALAPVRSGPLAAALADPTPLRDALAALWRPVDEKDLFDLNDIYEVAGRFSFQGEDNRNLGRVQALVSGARNEIVAQRGRLADLARLPGEARATASRLAAEEAARAAAARAEKTAAFEPLVEGVVTRAKQTFDAVRAVPFPDLASADAAAEEYRKYVAKLDQVYQTCLPFLRKAIASLYAFVGAEPTASWPDALPLERELPAELVTVPPAGSAELSQARGGLSALADEEIQLGRARDGIATEAARLEGEMAAAQMKDAELEAEIATAAAVIDYATAAEQAAATREAIAAIDQNRSQRVEAAGAMLGRQRQTEAGIKLLEEELGHRTQEITELGEQLVATKRDEPVLFGKDEWRSKVASFEERIELLRAAYGKRLSTLNGLKIDLSSISVQAQTAEAQTAVLDRQLAEARDKLVALQGTMQELGKKLGSSRPARPVAPVEAQHAVAALQQAKLEVAQRVERIKGEMRRQKDEAVRVLNRLKQVGIERQQLGAMLQSAETAATQGREEALRQLARERRAAVERHVGEVLGTLEKSLSLVGPVFVDPARELLLKSTEPRAEVSAKVLEAAEAAAPVVEKLGKELDPDLLAQDATLSQVQREFCDVAVSACRTAWST